MKLLDGISKTKPLELVKLNRENGEYGTVNSTYHISVCSIATDKVLAEKQEEIETFTRMKEGKL